MPSKGWVSTAPYLKQPLRDGTAEEIRQQVQDMRRERLCHALASETMVAFVGSGCSIELGYPSWDKLAIDLGKRAAEALETHQRIGDWSLSRFEWLRRRIETTAQGSAEAEGLSKPEKYSLLSIAQQILERCEPREKSEENAFQAYFRESFGPREQKAPSRTSVLDQLLTLPIRRFVTTNYDAELELTLGTAGDPPGSTWFTQEIEFLDQLTLFSLAREDAKKSVVFHCHGHYLRPRSIVATERDYQRWYVHDEMVDLASLPESSSPWASPAEAAAFRQTLEMLMGSNPILFVGAGLGEEDLLRPVRLLAALEPQQQQASQLFALRPRDPEASEDLALEALYERYGIQVITFESPLAERHLEAKHLARELWKLRKLFSAYRQRDAAKPKLRRAWPESWKSPPPAHYWHYIPNQPDTSGSPRLGNVGLEEKLKTVCDSFSNNRGAKSAGAMLLPAAVVVLLGRGGTGKSFLATELLRSQMDRPQDAGPPIYSRTFFWSSYYADDLLSGVDRLLGFLGLQDSDARRLGRLLEFFKPAANGEMEAEPESRILLVLDGIERLLVPTEHPEVGRPSNQAVKQFFAALMTRRPGIDVIVTTRLIPEPFVAQALNPDGEIRCHEAIEVHRMQRAAWEELKTLPPFGSDCFDEPKLSRICSLLDGHVYGLSLAAGLLSFVDAALVPQRFEDLCLELAGVPPDQRIGAMIRAAVTEAEGEARAGLVLELLRRLAAHLSPPGWEVLELCFEAAEKNAGEGDQLSTEQRSAVLENLGQRRLIFAVESQVTFAAAEGKKADSQEGWTIHPTLRSFLFESDKNLPGELLPNFTLAGFTSGTGVVHPKSPAVRRALGDLFKRLVEAARKAAGLGQSQTARSFCRSAFSTVRSRMEANTVARWTSYSEYAPYLIELIDLAKELSASELWDHSDPRHLKLVESEVTPLHADELAWLYNELGLVLCSEGNMRETYRLWEQGYEINRVIEQGLRPHAQYMVQSLLHLSHTFIELGRLDLAANYLQETHRANLDFGDDDYHCRILGYRALLAHLQGDFKHADRMYGEALKLLGEAKRNPRAEAIFSRFHADLRMHQGNLEGGRELLERSRALADAADYPDLVAFCRNSQGRYYRAKRRYQDALREYQAAWAMARKFGIRRLEADAFSEMSRLSLSLGDTASARQHALRALRLANQLGLGLRQVHGLVVLGLAAVAEKKLQLGRSYLGHARDLAFRRRYFLRGYEAQHKLEELGEPPGARAEL